LRQVGTGSNFWRRASQSPAPRSPAPSPVLNELDTPAPAQPPRPRRASPRHRNKFTARFVLLLAGAVSAAALLAGLPRGENSPAPALAEIERIVDLAGFGLTQVSVTGHRFTLDSDIFEALDLGAAPTMLSFDSRAAQDRIERLPWVERASIERIVPDRLEVRISERAPFAVWRRDTRHVLIDRTGRVLAFVAPDAMPELPRIAGEGAAFAVGRLMDLLASQPALAHQVVLAERIGGRRWALHLADGSTLQLPASREAQALARGLLIAAARQAQPGEIDLRVTERTLVREQKPSAGERIAAGGT
jgi:cell division protein FtsQ